MKVDLHLHTWISDGDVSPTEAVRLAAEAGLDVISITDHDTAKGVAEAMHAAAQIGLTVVPGIEISSRWQERELHILGYWIDHEATAIVQYEEQASRRRSDRMVAMIERLGRLGIELTYADVVAAAGPSVRTLGRPHLARALHHAGHTRYYSEAFVRYIGDEGPAFVAEGFPHPQTAIETIHAAGGVAVWAHPPLDWASEGMPLLAEWGLDGVECYRPGMDRQSVKLLEELTRKHELFPSGGSDWHGPQRFPLGEYAVEGRLVRRILEIGGLIP